MINHPNRSPLRPEVRIVLANAAGPPDERVISTHPRDTDEQVAQATAQAAAALILATTFLYPGDTITVMEIDLGDDPLGDWHGRNE